MKFWFYYELTQEELEDLWIYVNKPPQTFKLLGDFESNLTTVVEKFGLKLHPGVFGDRNTQAKPFLEVTTD